MRTHVFVGDRRTIPRTFYRRAPAVAMMTLDALGALRLPRPARVVLVALAADQFTTVQALTRSTPYQRRTIENALSALCRHGLIERECRQTAEPIATALESGHDPGIHPRIGAGLND